MVDLAAKLLKTEALSWMPPGTAIVLGEAGNISLRRGEQGARKVVRTWDRIRMANIPHHRLTPPQAAAR